MSCGRPHSKRGPSPKRGTCSHKGQASKILMAHQVGELRNEGPRPARRRIGEETKERPSHIDRSVLNQLTGLRESRYHLAHFFCSFVDRSLHTGAKRLPILSFFNRFGLADSDIGTGTAKWALNCRRKTILLVPSHKSPDIWLMFRTRVWLTWKLFFAVYSGGLDEECVGRFQESFDPSRHTA